YRQRPVAAVQAPVSEQVEGETPAQSRYQETTIQATAPDGSHQAAPDSQTRRADQGDPAQADHASDLHAPRERRADVGHRRCAGPPAEPGLRQTRQPEAAPDVTRCNPVDGHLQGAAARDGRRTARRSLYVADVSRVRQAQETARAELRLRLWLRLPSGWRG